jgi:hypothetical protein
MDPLTRKVDTFYSKSLPNRGVIHTKNGRTEVYRHPSGLKVVVTPHQVLEYRPVPDHTDEIRIFITPADKSQPVIRQIIEAKQKLSAPLKSSKHLQKGMPPVWQFLRRWVP